MAAVAPTSPEPAPATPVLPSSPIPPSSPVPVEQTEVLEGEGAVVEAGDPTVVTVQPLEGDVAPVDPEPALSEDDIPLPPVEEKPAVLWAHGLFGCFDLDPKLLGLSLACPCITFGANAEMMGEDWMLYCLFCLIPGATCYFGPYIRQKIRQTFGIDGTDNSDVLAYLLCPCLAIVQETQELKSGGMKPGGDAMNRA